MHNLCSELGIGRFGFDMGQRLGTRTHFAAHSFSVFHRILVHRRTFAPMPRNRCHSRCCTRNTIYNPTLAVDRAPIRCTRNQYLRRPRTGRCPKLSTISIALRQVARNEPLDMTNKMRICRRRLNRIHYIRRQGTSHDV